MPDGTPDARSWRSATVPAVGSERPRSESRLAPVTHVTTADGVSVAVYDFGGAGRDLILVHATGFCAAVLAPLATQLCRSHHCWAIELGTWRAQARVGTSLTGRFGSSQGRRPRGGPRSSPGPLLDSRAFSLQSAERRPNVRHPDSRLKTPIHGVMVQEMLGLDV